MRAFRLRNWCGNTTLNVGSTSHTGEPQPKLKEKVSWEPAATPLCVLTVDIMWPAASCPYPQDGLYSQPLHQKQAPWVNFVRYFPQWEMLLFLNLDRERQSTGAHWTPPGEYRPGRGVWWNLAPTVMEDEASPSLSSATQDSRQVDALIQSETGRWRARGAMVVGSRV